MSESTKTINVDAVMAAVPDEWRAAAREYLAAIAAATSEEERDAIKARAIDATVREARSRGWCDRANQALTEAFGDPGETGWLDSDGVDYRGNRPRRYDTDGYDQDGFDRDGYDRDGFGTQGWDREGYNRDGLDIYGISREGLDKDGRDVYRFHPHTRRDRDGFDRDGFSADGYDRDGFNARGYDREGYNREGLSRGGFDRSGLDRQGRDRWRFDVEGYDSDGYDSGGYDRDGYSRGQNTDRGRTPRLA